MPGECSALTSMAEHRLEAAIWVLVYRAAARTTRVQCTVDCTSTQMPLLRSGGAREVVNVGTRGHVALHKAFAVVMPLVLLDLVR
jgi:hypothetical protein